MFLLISPHWRIFGLIRRPSIDTFIRDSDEKSEPSRSSVWGARLLIPCQLSHRPFYRERALARILTIYSRDSRESFPPWSRVMVSFCSECKEEAVPPLKDFLSPAALHSPVAAVSLLSLALSPACPSPRIPPYPRVPLLPFHSRSVFPSSRSVPLGYRRDLRRR